jgi:hypothetical protein
MRLAICDRMGDGSSSEIVGSKVVFILVFMGRNTSDKPFSFRASMFGRVMPPDGPKVADLTMVSMCGDDVECLRARLCRIGGFPGEGGTSAIGLLNRSDVFVLRLNMLGFRFIAGICGLMKEGDPGSETRLVVGVVLAADGGWIERPFMFLGRRGDGDVIGRLKVLVSDASGATGGLLGRPPNVVEG